jgi:hypothetical protein
VVIASLAQAMTVIEGLMSLKKPMHDLEHRMPVWAAMTDFFLDTELSSWHFRNMATVCAESPYSERDLERILFTEVWPAFLPNLLSVAGEWAGWQDDFIKQRILATYRRRIYISWRLNPLKWFFCREWRRVSAMVRTIRSGAAITNVPQ